MRVSSTFLDLTCSVQVYRLIRRIASLAETYYTAVAPNHEGGPVGTAIAIQLAASLPNFFIQHVPVPAAEQDRRMRAELAGADIEAVRDGFLALPKRPGSASRCNEAALDKYKDENRMKRRHCQRTRARWQAGCTVDPC